MHRFLSARWQGRVDASRLFWKDILVVGTVVNLCATFVALIGAAQDAAGLAVLLHFTPLPYNGFLVLSMLRTTGRTPAQMVGSGIWIAAMTVI